VNRLWFGVSGLVLSLLVVTVVWGGDDTKPTKPFGPKDGIFPGMQFPLLTPKMMENLKLSDEQKEKIETLLKEFHEKQKEAMTKFRDTLEKVQKEKNPSNPPKIGQLYQEFIASARKHHAAEEGKLKDLLTEEQKKKYEELKKELHPPPSTFPPFAGTQPPFPGPGQGPMMMMMRPFPGHIVPPFIEVSLKLTKEQKEKIAKIQKEAEEKVMEVFNDDQKKQAETMKKAFEKSFPTPPVPPKETKPKD
jgi:Spy/CpxP family protein refolding chaperone